MQYLRRYYVDYSRSQQGKDRFESQPSNGGQLFPGHALRSPDPVERRGERQGLGADDDIKCA